MIKTLIYEGDDGARYVRTFSSRSVKIMNESGVMYDDAIDIENHGHTYTETDVPVYEGKLCLYDYTGLTCIEPDEGDIMKYSTLSIKRELAKLGKWDEAKALIVRSGAWDDYILANYLAENDPVFIAAKAAFVAAGILTADELAGLLPRCVCTAE